MRPRFSKFPEIIVLFIISLISVYPGFLLGSENKSVAAFLQLPASAEAVALSGNAVVLGEGLASVAANPAVLSVMKSDEFQASYGQHLEGYQFFNAGYGHRTDFLNYGLNIIRLAASDFKGRDSQGVRTGGFSAYDTVVNFSAAKNFNGLSLGLNLKYIGSVIETESASDFAVDIGGIIRAGAGSAHPCKFGFAFTNFGPAMKYISRAEPLPATLAAGLATDITNFAAVSINAVRNIADKTLEAGAGARINIGKIFSLSGGVGREMAQSAAPLRLNAGIKFQVSNMDISYAFAPMGEIGNTQRMSICFRFGKGSRTAVAENMKAVGSGWKL